MPHVMKRMNPSRPIWAGIGLASCSLVVSLSACTPKPPVSVVIPDSHELRPGVVCDGKGDCTVDPNRVTIDLGYLRELIDLLDVCRKQRI